jgi:hypothetical protein
MHFFLHCLRLRRPGRQTFPDPISDPAGRRRQLQYIQILKILARNQCYIQGSCRNGKSASIAKKWARKGKEGWGVLLLWTS